MWHVKKMDPPSSTFWGDAIGKNTSLGLSCVFPNLGYQTFQQPWLTWGLCHMFFRFQTSYKKCWCHGLQMQHRASLLKMPHWFWPDLSESVWPFSILEPSPNPNTVTTWFLISHMNLILISWQELPLWWTNNKMTSSQTVTVGRKTYQD